MTRFGQAAVWLGVVGAVVGLSYQPVVENALVWDDTHTVARAEFYSHVDSRSLRWIFTTSLGGHYQPLTWLSFALDHQVWGGLSAPGIHLTNVLLHVLTAFLLFLICLEMLGRLSRAGGPPQAVLAALFATLWWAVHPLRVESVAWATERRDVLSGLFLALTVFLYVRWTIHGGRNKRMLVLAVLCYSASLLSKAAGITLPLVLILLDIYPLKRIGRSMISRRNRGVLLEKLLFLLPAVAVACLALRAQAAAGALRSLGEHPLGLRCMQACYGIVFYLGKLVWPAALRPLYEQDPSATAWQPVYLLSLLSLVALTAVAVRLRSKWPALLIAWLVYLTLLLPVLGLAQSGPQLVADRYTYLASLPWAVLLAWCLLRLLTRPGVLPRGAWSAAMVGVVLVFAAQTRSQVRVWKDEYTLWSTTVELAPQTGMAQANLALELNRRGEYRQAIDHARLALARLPGNRAAHLALGLASLQLSEFPQAAEHLAISLQIADDVGKTDVAAMVALAAANAGLGDREGARALYERAIAAEPEVAEWEFQYGSFLASVESFEEASNHLERAIALDPMIMTYYLRLAIAERRLGRDPQAVEVLSHGLMITPSDIELRAELAWILATTGADELRDGDKALTLAQQVVEDSAGRCDLAKEALAAAHAETGEFSAAVEIVQRELARPDIPSSRRQRLEQALTQYRQRAPFREQPAAPAPRP